MGDSRQRYDKSATIILGADYPLFEGTTEWPLRVPLHFAYGIVCGAAANFPCDTPKEALLSAFRSGEVRAVRGKLKRTIRQSLEASSIERHFDEELMPPVDWVRCLAFNPLDGTINDAEGRVVSPIEIYAADLLSWLCGHGGNPGEYRFEYLTEDIAVSEFIHRAAFEDNFILASGDLATDKKGRPRIYRWDRAITNVLLEEYYLNSNPKEVLDRGYLMQRLYDEFADYEGGPASSGVQEFADMILNEMAKCRRRRQAKDSCPR
jgi:hypothetical protein